MMKQAESSSKMSLLLEPQTDSSNLPAGYDKRSYAKGGLKRSIIEALRYMGRPISLDQIVHHVKFSNNRFASNPSVNELIYNTLFEMCGAKVVVKVIGTASNEIQYHLPGLMCPHEIDLKFNGSLGYESSSSARSTTRGWMTLRGVGSKFSDGHRPCSSIHHFIPVTDAMIHESFGARAGLRTKVEGLQRPNTPADISLKKIRCCEAGDSCSSRGDLMATGHSASNNITIRKCHPKKHNQVLRLHHQRRSVKDCPNAQSYPDDTTTNKGLLDDNEPSSCYRDDATPSPLLKESLPAPRVVFTESSKTSHSTNTNDNNAHVPDKDRSSKHIQFINELQEILSSRDHRYHF